MRKNQELITWHDCVDTKPGCDRNVIIQSPAEIVVGYYDECDGWMDYENSNITRAIRWANMPTGETGDS